MINGVTILATNIVTTTNPILNIIFIALLVIAGLGLLFIFIGITTNCAGISEIGLISLITAFILMVICIPINIATRVPDYNIYEVILDDSVSINEFMNTYEVLEQRGQIYVVKEKEK